MKRNALRFALVILLGLHGLQLKPSANAQTAQAPVITNQPASQSFFEGQTATFSVGAVGTAPLSYQWWIWNPFNIYPILGATNSTLSFNSAQYYGNDGWWLWVIVTNVAGSTESDEIYMGVYGLPTSEPSSASVFIGHDAIFTVSYSFWDGLGYDEQPWPAQWQFNGTSIPGATNYSYTVPNAQLTNAGSYSFVITNPAGSVASPPAILQVVPFGAPSIQINNQFALGSVSAIASAALRISGGFTNGLIFYTLDGTTPTTSSPLYAGPATLTRSAIVQTMGLSADFTQTAFAPAVAVQIIPVYNLQTSVMGSGTITIGPTNGPYASNTVVVLTADAAANWAFDHWTGDVTGSQNPVSLTMNRPRSVQAVFVQTAYPLTASTAGGGSVTANGQVISPATFYPIGSEVTLSAAASNGWSFLRWQGDSNGTANPLSMTMNQAMNIQAIFGTVVGTNTSGGGGIVLSEPNPISYGTVLTASAVPNSGEYFITWSGSASGTNAPTTILVTDANPTVGALFTTLPGGKYSLAVVLMGNGSVAISPQRSYYSPGDSVTLSASTTIAGTRFYGWTGDASGTNNSLEMVVKSNSIVQANFVGLPTVNISPLNLIVVAGSNAVLNANAAGLPPLSYQWQFGSTNIAGATTSFLTLTNVQPSQAGNYLVIVSNSIGSVTSAVAILTVDVPPGAPVITSQPGSLAVRSGESASFTVVATGNAPLLYEWYHGVSGDTSSPVGLNRPDYTTGALTNNTSYWVSVGNSLGTVASDTAWATVVPAQTPKLSFQILAGYPVITLDGKVGTNYVLQYKNSLTDSSWTPLLYFNLSANPFTFFDTTATGVPRRLYGAYAH